jgi:hypothetical protein
MRGLSFYSHVEIKLLHDRTISLKGEACAHKTSLTPQPYMHQARNVSGHVTDIDKYRKSPIFDVNHIRKPFDISLNQYTVMP